MAIGPCVVVAEEQRLDVGRGVALLSIDMELGGAGRQGRCEFDATSVVRAREEGRAPPELIAFRITDGEKIVRVGGPSDSIHAVVDGPSVHIVAVLRGDRFALVPIAVDRDARAKSSHYAARATSVWGAHAIAGTATFIQSGAPALVTVDPSRDHERTSIAYTIEHDPVPALVLDAGPILGELTIATEEARRIELAKGGAAALSVLLSDLPASVASAPSDAASVERLREAARAARAAVLSNDAMLNAVGERLLTAVLNGFSSCRRSAEPGLPPRWPAPRRELVATGILDDAETGCPRIDDLLRTNHPDVRFTREGDLAVADAAKSNELPRMGPMVPGGAPSVGEDRDRFRAAKTVLFAFFAAVLVFFFWDQRSAKADSRDGTA